MLLTLIRKDFRLQLPVLIAAGLLFVAPAVIYFGVDAVIGQPTDDPLPVLAMLAAMFMLGIGAASLTVPAFTGVAAARERRERSAEFLEAMPVDRWKIVTSRALVAVVCGLLPATVGAISIIVVVTADSSVGGGPDEWASAGPEFNEDFIRAMMAAAGTIAAAAGVAWLIGSLVRSEVIAAAMGIAIPSCVHTVVYIALERISADSLLWLGIERDGPAPYTAAQFAVAIPCLIAGTIIALRRRTP